MEMFLFGFSSNRRGHFTSLYFEIIIICIVQHVFMSISDIVFSSLVILEWVVILLLSFRNSLYLGINTNYDS